MKIAFIHPDLGIGGAERLIVDAAVGLQNRGHHVTMLTSHCDKSHCFDEISDETLKVQVLGDSIFPPNISGRFTIVCAIFRQLHLVWQLITSGEAKKYDLFIIDLLSACVPVLRHFVPGRILFYCHFPDQLLTERKSLLKKLYRIPFDYMEQWALGVSDVIVVNSRFTQSVFLKTFAAMSRVPDVIYPCVDTTNDKKEQDEEMKIVLKNSQVVCSINGFERKKNIELAIIAFSESNSRGKNAKLVIAGGYDQRVSENVEYHKELQAKASDLGLIHVTIFSKESFQPAQGAQVIFMPSISSLRKQTLLDMSLLLLYTPENEHFGIVPLEAMLAGTPVLATNTGGPLETIFENETGWNRPSDPYEWSKIIDRALNLDSKERQRMSANGISRVKENFSEENMGKEFELGIKRALSTKRQTDKLGKIISWLMTTIVILSVLVMLAITRRVMF